LPEDLEAIAKLARPDLYQMVGRLESQWLRFRDYCQAQGIRPRNVGALWKKFIVGDDGREQRVDSRPASRNGTSGSGARPHDYRGDLDEPPEPDPPELPDDAWPAADDDEPQETLQAVRLVPGPPRPGKFGDQYKRNGVR
jgi:hypothetical protein